MKHSVNCWNSLRASTATTGSVMVNVNAGKGWRLANQQPSLSGMRGRFNAQRKYPGPGETSTNAEGVLPMFLNNCVFSLHVNGRISVEPKQNMPIFFLSPQGTEIVPVHIEPKRMPCVAKDGDSDSLRHEPCTTDTKFSIVNSAISVKKSSEIMPFKIDGDFGISDREGLVGAETMPAKIRMQSRATNPKQCTIPRSNETCFRFFPVNRCVTAEMKPNTLKNVNVRGADFNHDVVPVFMKASISSKKAEDICLLGGIQFVKEIMIDGVFPSTVSTPPMKRFWNSKLFPIAENGIPVDSISACNLLIRKSRREFFEQGFSYFVGDAFGHYSIVPRNIFVGKTSRYGLILLERAGRQDKKPVDNKKWLFSRKAIVKFYDESVLPKDIGAH